MAVHVNVGPGPQLVWRWKFRRRFKIDKWKRPVLEVLAVRELAFLQYDQGQPWLQSVPFGFTGDSARENPRRRIRHRRDNWARNW